VKIARAENEIGVLQLPKELPGCRIVEKSASISNTAS